MRLNDFKTINEMAAASPWTTYVRGLIIANPSITDSAINALVAQQGITPPNFLKVRLDGLRKSIADQTAKHGAPKTPKATTQSTTPTNTTAPTPAATPTPKPTPKPATTAAPQVSGNDPAHIQKISDWLDSHNVINYTIDPNTYVIDVDGDVHLDNFYHTKLPVKFGKVSGDFYVAATGITTLEGCPTFVDGRFACQNNKGLKSAVGGPEIVMGSVDFENCPISKFDGFPREVHGNLDLIGTKFTSFAGVHKHIKMIDGILSLGKTASKITDSITGLMLVRKLKDVNLDWDSKQTKPGQAFEILCNHLKGDRILTECQIELQDAGLAIFAKM